MSEELKPCPFCGPSGHVRVMTHTFYNEVACIACGCSRTAIKRSDAVSAWNRRQQVPDGYAVVPVGAIGKFTAAGRSINPIAVSTLVREGLAIMDAMKPEDVK